MATAKLLQQTQIPADIVLTDYHTQVLSNLEHNVQENFPTTDESASSASVTVEPLDWLEVHNEVLQGALDLEQPKYDLMLLADVIYAPEHALWIRSSIEALLRKPSSDDNAIESASRAHIIMAVRGTGKFEGLHKTVEDAFMPRVRLDKRSNVGRNDEQEYLWFEVGWTM
uniref:Uncharacterized protein n=1 Tax=Kalmanozyma brasiliensis (strain GHG001) TaxID=1365824 RepID=V5EYJ9_KALBG